MSTLDILIHYVERLENRFFVLDVIIDDGWEELGQGHFSTIFQHKDFPDHVIKLNKREGDCWPIYAKYCVDNVNNEKVNKHLPAIHKFIRLKNNKFIAVLDKLEEVAESDGSDMADAFCSIEEVLDVYCGLNTFEPYEWYGCAEYFKVDEGYEAVRIAHIEAEERNTELYRTAKTIRDELCDYCDIDIHLGNFMLDKNGVVIITDPVSSSTGRDYRKDAWASNEIEELEDVFYNKKCA